MNDQDRESLYRAVARLHAENIGQGFLPSLGQDSLALLYRTTDESSESTLIPAYEDNQVCGFIAGAIQLKPVYLRLLLHWPALFMALAPSLLRPTRLWRILEILRYSREDGVDTARVPLPDAELLGLAVAPGCRDRGHADSLYEGLRRFFARQGQVSFKIMVGADLSRAIHFYRRMGAVPAAEITLHRGASSTVYVQACTDAGGNSTTATV